MGGLEICCGAWAVRHLLFGHPTITLSHFPSFSDGQSHRQALQLSQPRPSELCDWRSCSMAHPMMRGRNPSRSFSLNLKNSGVAIRKGQGGRNPVFEG